MKMGKSHFDGQQYRPRFMLKTMTFSELMIMILMLWRAGGSELAHLLQLFAGH